MYASNAQDAIPTLIDQGDNDQFLADQLQPAVLAEAARQKAWPMTLRIQPGALSMATATFYSWTAGLKRPASISELNMSRQIRSFHTVWILQNSCKPKWESSRPKPLFFTPPKATRASLAQ